MNCSFGQPFLLSGIFGFILLISGRVALDPHWGKPAPYQFSEVLAIANWKLVGSQPKSLLIEVDENPKRANVGYQYRYQQENLIITVNAYYITNSQGDINRDFFNTSKPLMANQPNLKIIQHQSKAGFYSTFHTQNKAYLYSCINPSGPSTVTAAQFRSNRQAEVANVHLLLLAFAGLRDLRDQRCLWTEMSIPLKRGISHQTANQQLEIAWNQWQNWWQSHFPEL